MSAQLLLGLLLASPAPPSTLPSWLYLSESPTSNLGATTHAEIVSLPGSLDGVSDTGLALGRLGTSFDLGKDLGGLSIDLLVPSAFGDSEIPSTGVLSVSYLYPIAEELGLNGRVVAFAGTGTDRSELGGGYGGGELWFDISRAWSDIAFRAALGGRVTIESDVEVAEPITALVEAEIGWRPRDWASLSSKVFLSHELDGAESLSAVASLGLTFHSLRYAFSIGAAAFDFRNTEQTSVGGFVGFSTAFGERDSDGDGLVDSSDACPVLFGDVKLAGCPFVDNDADGVHDPFDACLGEAGTIRNAGCSAD